MDEDVLRKARKYADERYPLGEHTPAAAAARTAMLTFLLLIFDRLEHWFGFPVAISIATATATATIWFDTNQRWMNHAKAQRDAVQWFEGDRDH